MEFEELLNLMIENEYFKSKEIKYLNELNALYSPNKYKEFLNYKDSLINKNDERFINLPLKSYSSKYIFYVSNLSLLELSSTFYNLQLEDYEETNSFLNIRNLDEITKSRIYSETEGTLNIEAVPTTRKKVEDIASGKVKPNNDNEIIIHNMIEGIKFISTSPSFNKDNLLKLYKILSKDSLNKEDEIKEDRYYRDNEVEVALYPGCPSNKIEECMDSLFEYVNNSLTNIKESIFLPYIVHYYILYIHPYFDFNGRTARMVSLWIANLSKLNNINSLMISEAINQTKNQYYKSISESRDAHNDLTYFLLYIYDISIKYFLTYKNIEHIEMVLKNNYIDLSSIEKNYIKKILISSNGVFSYKDFIKFIKVDMTKQGALKMLNKFVKYKILKEKASSSNLKLFVVNSNIIKYKAF